MSCELSYCFRPVRFLKPDRSKTITILEILEQNHIYNRGNNKQDIFLEKQNYFCFFKITKKVYPPNNKSL